MVLCVPATFFECEQCQKLKMESKKKRWKWEKKFLLENFKDFCLCKLEGKREEMGFLGLWCLSDGLANYLKHFSPFLKLYEGSLRDLLTKEI